MFDNCFNCSINYNCLVTCSLCEALQTFVLLLVFIKISIYSVRLLWLLFPICFTILLYAYCWLHKLICLSSSRSYWLCSRSVLIWKASPFTEHTPHCYCDIFCLILFIMCRYQFVEIKYYNWWQTVFLLDISSHNLWYLASQHNNVQPI